MARPTEERSIAREAAMQLVFEQLFGGASEAQTLVDLIDYTPSEVDQQYINEVVAGVREYAMDLDAEISSCLRGWTIARLSRVDLAILRLSAFEMKYMGLAAPISINEAVELARKYSNETSCAFINGVLGTISRKLASQE